MTTFKSLLVATDFSVDGNNAVRRAALLAHEHGAALRILHVLKAAGCQPLRDWFSPTIDVDLKAAQSREALRRVAVEISSAYDLTPRVEVVVGDPFEALLQASQLADLVVLGQRGHSRLEALRVGGTVDRMRERRIEGLEPAAEARGEKSALIVQRCDLVLHGRKLILELHLALVEPVAEARHAVHTDDRVVRVPARHEVDLGAQPHGAQVAIDGPQPTNVHYHGMDVAPKLPDGDNVFIRIKPQKDLRYDVFVPRDHPQGLHWYHAHVHHYVDDQIGSGISGMLIVDGFIEKQYPELAGLRQRVMLLKDFTFPGFKDGDARAKSLNGFADPPIRARPGEFQVWELGNLGADAFFDMKLLELRYADRQQARSRRIVEPQYLFLNWPVWYLLGWDHLRQDVRFFRLDRIRQAKALRDSFKLRPERLFDSAVQGLAQSI